MDYTLTARWLATHRVINHFILDLPIAILSGSITFTEARHACIVRFRTHMTHYRNFSADTFMNTVTAILLTIKLLRIGPQKSKLIDFQESGVSS